MTRRDGYVVDVAYPLHFYKEMQPTWLSYMVNVLGCEAPSIDFDYAYCELGCGKGINLLVAAACNPMGDFLGVDFNVEHIATARSIAAEVGINNVQFIESSFEEFAKSNDKKFNFIVSHGVWSWLPPKSQLAILQIVQSALLPQGIFYLQYMCYPGAARLIALQRVLYEVSLANNAGSIASVSEGLKVLRQLAEGGAGLFVDSPEIVQELEALEKLHPEYLAHDFLTDFWRPQHSTEVHQIASQIGLSYIGSADGWENMDALAVPGNVQKVIANASSRRLKEILRDVSRSQSQRTDIFQKQPRGFTASAHFAALDGWEIQALEKMPIAGALEFVTPIGKVDGPAEIFLPLMQELKSGAKTFEQLRKLPLFEKEPGILLQSLSMLLWAGYAHPVRKDRLAAPAAHQLQTWINQEKLPLKLESACGNAFMV